MREFFNEHLVELVEREAWLDLFAAAPPDCTRSLGLASLRFEDFALLASRHVPIVEFNRALCSGAAGLATPRKLGYALSWLQTLAAPGWALQIVPSAETDTVADWLSRNAMIPSGQGWAKLSRSAMPPADFETTDIQLRPVDAERAGAFGEIVQSGFDLPRQAAKWFAALYGRPSWELYLGYEGDTPVASAATFTRYGMAWLGIDTTLPDYRRRGAQTALINRRLQDGCAARLIGFTAETSQPPAGHEASHTSYMNYMRAGFFKDYVRPNYKLA